MNRISIFISTTVMCLFLFSCGSNKNSDEQGAQKDSSSNLMKDAEMMKGDNKGIGKFKDIALTHPLDEAMIGKGQTIFTTKCFACHKLTEEKLVGPGWKGVTDRRTSEWIMNFITNTDVMIDSDIVAQKMFVTCLVRMPSQGISDADARNILEFMRKNDGKN